MGKRSGIAGRHLVLAALSSWMVACSSARGHEPGAAEQLVQPPPLSPQDLSASVSSTGSLADIDWSNPISVMTTPNAGCAIRPEGSADGRQDFVSASGDAVIRFYPPPNTWGSKFALECTAADAESPSLSYSVDLDDSSTFFREPELLSGANVAGERPAFSGDLLAATQQQLRTQGFPMRPDPTNTEAYAAWKQNVTTAAQIIDLKPVFAIGREHAVQVRYNWPYSGSLSNWCGQIVDPGGFNQNAGETGGVQLTSFEENIGVTSPQSGCPDPPCEAFFWGGLGGYGPSGGSLIQAGYILTQGTGGPSSALFVEFAPAALGVITVSQLPPAASGALTPGNRIIAEG
jgi:hypothetical protein